MDLVDTPELCPVGEKEAPSTGNGVDIKGPSLHGETGADGGRTVTYAGLSYDYFVHIGASLVSSDGQIFRRSRCGR